MIPTIKMKFTRCVTMIQPGTPELKVGVDGTHECVRMYDWAGPVPMNSFSATTIAIPATATAGTSHHTEMKREPSRKCTSLSRSRGCGPSSLSSVSRANALSAE